MLASPRSAAVVKVARSIQSAHFQVYSAAEILVVHDGSKDGTADAVRRFGDSVGLIQRENGRSSAAGDRVVKAAWTHWIALLDFVDCWAVDHLSRIAGAVGRATEPIGHRAEAFWLETEWLYGDVLARYPDLPSHRPGKLAARLDGAHLRLAKRAPRRRASTGSYCRG